MSDGPPADEQAPDLLSLAGELRGVLGSLVRQLRARGEFPLGQAQALLRLDRGGPSSIGELATGERVRPQSMAQLVGELEALGLVQRAADPNDGRRAIIDLTEDGRSRLAAERSQRDGWLAEQLAASCSPDELAAIATAVRALARVGGGA